MTPPGSRGWVYVLTNPAMPGVVKVGCTGRTPADRARELSDKTGVPSRFVVAWAWPVSDWRAVEAMAHNRLARFRTNRNREFFACSVRQARRAIKAEAAAYLRPVWLRLLIGPWSSRSAPVNRKRQRGEPVPVLAVYGLVAAVLAVGWFKPLLPSWLPSGAARMAAFIELHALP